jgi:mitochondrial import inner membrane translocase subunit TIM16
MAIGPLARLLAQVVVPLIAVVARALPAAYAQALNNAKKSGTASAETVNAALRKTVTRQEALQILNLTEESATAEAVERQFEKYMAANEVKKGAGSFYLQSKVYRAREQLADFQAEKRREEMQKTSTTTASESNNSKEQ